MTTDPLELALQAAAKGKNPPINPIVPIVNRVGQFKEPRCGPLKDTRSGAQLVYWNSTEGRCGLTKQAREAGWEFYEDVCRGDYAPAHPDKQGHVDAKTGLRYWRAWEETKRRMGQRGDVDSEDEGQPYPNIEVQGWDNSTHYHPEVVERRKSSRHGQLIDRIDLDRFFEDDEEDGDAEDELVASLDKPKLPETVSGGLHASEDAHPEFMGGAPVDPDDPEGPKKSTIRATKRKKRK